MLQKAFFRLCLLWWLCCCAIAAHAVSVAEIADALAGRDFAAKMAAVEQIAQADLPDSQAVFVALEKGSLYATVDGLFIQSKEGFVDAATMQLAAPVGVKKVLINNKIRQFLKVRGAAADVAGKVAGVRLKAVNALLKQRDFSARQAVLQQLKIETNGEVKQAMKLFLAYDDLRSSDANVQLAAIEVLRDHGAADDRAALLALAENSDVSVVKEAAMKAAQGIAQRLALLSGVETLSFGLSLGSILVLTAIGLAITFGVMGVINMAHGELIMIGAYTAYVVQQLMPNHITASIFLAIPAAFLVSGAVGVLIERFVVRYLYGRPLETLLATFGVSLFLQQAVRTIFSPLNRLVKSPEFMSGSWQVTPGLAITWNRIYIFLFCMICFLLLLTVMKRSRLGLEVRAVSMNRDMARAVGISDRKVDMLTFGLGSGIAGVAGVALSQLMNVGPNLGQGYIVDSFMVVVVGGVGNLWGTLVSGLSLGVLNKVIEPWSGAVLAKAILLVLIILFIQRFPRGLFPQKGRGVA